MLRDDRLRPRRGRPRAGGRRACIAPATCTPPASASRSTARSCSTRSTEFESGGWDLGAIYHSHTHTDPYPSQTDINFAANWPGLEWVIVGLAGEEPDVRCYLIEDGQVRPVELEVR